MTKIQHMTSSRDSVKGAVIGVEQPLVRSVSSKSTKYIPPGTTAAATMSTIGTKPTLIEVEKMKFLIMDAPRQGNLHLYIKEMKKHSVTDVVRACEPTYQGAELQAAGMTLHDMEYADGHSPARELIDQWLQLVEKTFYSQSSDGAKVCIAVHCVAGLGRAPVMVALALIEFANMDPVEAVSLIRRHRRGAINEKQLLYLEEYKRHYRKNGAQGGCCIIS